MLQESLDGRSSGFSGFGVSTERSSSRQGSPSRQSEGIKVVNLSEHALAASDFAEELRSGRRALESIDVNVNNSMKNGRTPAFVGQTAFVMRMGDQSSSTGRRTRWTHPLREAWR